MARVGDMSPSGEYWSDCWRGRWATPEPPPAEVEHDADRHVIGRILGPKGETARTVRRPDAVRFGYRGGPR